jgi:hypothetical protein
MLIVSRHHFEQVLARYVAHFSHHRPVHGTKQHQSNCFHYPLRHHPLFAFDVETDSERGYTNTPRSHDWMTCLAPTCRQQL